MYSPSTIHPPFDRRESAPGRAPSDPSRDDQSGQEGGDRPTAESQYVQHAGVRSDTVLIVENEENNRRLVEQILGFAGYSYISASNGLEALDVLARKRVQVVLIDLSMPILDGYRTTELIRQRPECAALPIVAVTAHAMSEDRELALRCGCTDYLAKPFRPNELLTVVARMLADASC
jgi:CheY-like chemotaxis protein